MDIANNQIIALPVPSKQEHWAYYYGLPSHPRLVARSSTTQTPWEPPRSPCGQWPAKKVFLPAGGHKIAGLWNIHGSPLVRDVMTALADKSIEWTAIDILRVGFDYESSKSDGDKPVVLFVSVKPDSTEPQLGFEVAVRCKGILESYEIFDMHCEIKESVVSRLPLAADSKFTSPRTSAQPNRASDEGASEASVSVTTPSGPSHIVLGRDLEEGMSKYYIEKVQLPLSHYAGRSIAPLNQPSKMGTKGLYLRRRDTGAILALTCRHVALADDHKSILENMDYVYKAHGERLDMIQLGDKAWEDVKREVQLEPQYFEARLNYYYYETREAPAGGDRDEPRKIQELLTHCEGLEEKIKKLDNPESRVFGHVVFSPSYSLGQTSSGGNRLRNWALIELHQNAHQSPLKKLESQLYIDCYRRHKIESLQSEFPCSNPPGLLHNYVDSSFTLCRSITETEMGKPFSLTKDNDPTIPVGKDGAGSELTVRFTNTIRSLLRHHLDGHDVYSSEICIIGYDNPQYSYSGTFSSPADFRSCVWDFGWRVARIVTSGSSAELTTGSDVTYFTPFEWLLEDIRSYGFNVEPIYTDNL